MQIVTDIMGQRPRLDLKASYFVDGYTAEIQLLETHRNLMR